MKILKLRYTIPMIVLTVMMELFIKPREGLYFSEIVHAFTMTYIKVFLFLAIGLSLLIEMIFQFWKRDICLRRLFIILMINVIPFCCFVIASQLLLLLTNLCSTTPVAPDFAMVIPGTKEAKIIQAWNEQLNTHAVLASILVMGFNAILASVFSSYLRKVAKAKNLL